MKKVLMLTPYLPYPLLSGGQIRTYNLLKQLAKRYKITLFALIKSHSERRHVRELKKYCHEVQVFKRSRKPFTLSNIIRTGFSSYPFLVIRNRVPEIVPAVEKALLANYDIIHAETFYMMPHLPKTKVPIILVEQTIEYLGYESYAQKAPWYLRPLLSIDIAKIKYWEKFYWNRADRLILMSEDDRSLVSKKLTNPHKTAVVANGVDTAWFSAKKRQEPSQPTLLSVGTFRWLPNVEAVDFLLDKIWPLVKEKLPSAKLWVVGNEPTQEVIDRQKKDPSLQVTGGIPDIRDAFAKSHVLIAPVLSGKGTRYKVLEAMAAGTTVVATPLAVEGLQIKHGQHALIGQTTEELVLLATKALKDAELRKKLATQAKKFVKKYYDWQHIANQLDNIYQTIDQDTKR